MSRSANEISPSTLILIEIQVRLSDRIAARAFDSFEYDNQYRRYGYRNNVFAHSLIKAMVLL